MTGTAFVAAAHGRDHGADATHGIAGKARSYGGLGEMFVGAGFNRTGASSTPTIAIQGQDGASVGAAHGRDNGAKSTYAVAGKARSYSRYGVGVVGTALSRDNGAESTHLVAGKTRSYRAAVRAR